MPPAGLMLPVLLSLTRLHVLQAALLLGVVLVIAALSGSLASPSCWRAAGDKQRRRGLSKRLLLAHCQSRPASPLLGFMISLPFKRIVGRLGHPRYSPLQPGAMRGGGCSRRCSSCRSSSWPSWTPPRHRQEAAVAAPGHVVCPAAMHRLTGDRDCLRHLHLHLHLQQHRTRARLQDGPLRHQQRSRAGTGMERGLGRQANSLLPWHHPAHNHPLRKL